MTCEPSTCSVGRTGVWPYAPLLAVLLIPALAAALAVAGEPAAPAAERVAPRAVAVTFDDVPGVATLADPCDPDGLRDLNDRILDALDRLEIPATALVVGGAICDAHRDSVLPGLLRRWVDAGHRLGNHTFSHRDLNTVDLEWYTADIARNQAYLEPFLERGEPRWFRPPLLHAGDTPTRRDGLREYLDRWGYRLAPVTLDNQEWIFADVYVRAKAAGDSAVARRVAAAYVPFMDSVAAFFEARSRAVLGREIPQVLLLHANELNADHLPALAGMLRARGYRFVPLAAALRDPAYAREDAYVGPRGLSWIHRWAIGAGGAVVEEPREPAWLVELRRSYIARGL